MIGLTPALALTTLSAIASIAALSGCIEDPLSVGDDDGGPVEQCVSECRKLASACGHEDTCEKSCDYIDAWGCLAESHDLYQCKADGADICKAPQCEQQAKASLDCTHAYCDAHPGKDGCSGG
jgi:hypothetical protein